MSTVQQTMQDKNEFACWAVIEVFGHAKYSGYVSTAKVGDSSMIELAVPDIKKDGRLVPGFTKYLHLNSIFSITPVGKDYALAMAERLTMQPITGYEHLAVIRMLAENALNEMVTEQKIELLERWQKEQEAEKSLEEEEPDAEERKSRRYPSRGVTDMTDFYTERMDWDEDEDEDF